MMSRASSATAPIRRTMASTPHAHGSYTMHKLATTPVAIVVAENTKCAAPPRCGAWHCACSTRAFPGRGQTIMRSLPSILLAVSFCTLGCGGITDGGDDAVELALTG